MSLGKHMDVSVYQKAKKGNYYCGDSYFYNETETEFVCALADGLGSGEFAKESSDIVMQIIKDHSEVSVNELVRICNKQLIGKRGVVLGLLKINFEEELYTFSSIGNIGIMTISSKCEKKRNIPNAGYLGGFHKDFKVVGAKLDPNMTFVMFSDGVEPKQLSAKYFLEHNVSTITEAFSNGEMTYDDDTTLIVMKYT
ncbi:indirect negative regulator of sigma-B activity [Radiobacillus sp. PE A8.2]|uniref:indirect negative regulator of sigma-B activity n=1 Tax=Radiobacillus sp. PE A8.2 TaxID=3380349 RepID=UPI00388CF2DA